MNKLSTTEKKKSSSKPAVIHLNKRTGECALSIQLDNQSIIDTAKQLIGRSFKRYSKVLDEADKVRDFLLLNMATFEQEVFACLFLDNDQRLIAFEPIFYGSINSTEVHSREIIKQALALNAAAIIAVHNHPSGNCKPSRRDQVYTYQLHSALLLMEIKLLDHLIVGSKQVLSMVEKGYFNPDNNFFYPTTVNQQTHNQPKPDSSSLGQGGEPSGLGDPCPKDGNR